MIVTIGVEDLLAKAGMAETTDGTQLSSDQLLRIADEAEILARHHRRNGVPLALGTRISSMRAEPFDKLRTAPVEVRAFALRQAQGA